MTRPSWILTTLKLPSALFLDLSPGWDKLLVTMSLILSSLDKSRFQTNIFAISYLDFIILLKPFQHLTQNIFLHSSSLFSYLTNQWKRYFQLSETSNVRPWCLNYRNKEWEAVSDTVIFWLTHDTLKTVYFDRLNNGKFS